jgi:hypothetical protein
MHNRKPQPCLESSGTPARCRPLLQAIAHYDINDFLPAKRKSLSSCQTNRSQTQDPPPTDRTKSGGIQKVRRSEGVQAKPLLRNEATQAPRPRLELAPQYELVLAPKPRADSRLKTQ